MTTELTWLGHGGWSLKADGHRILLDPFLENCPTAVTSRDEIEADFILVSHGHFDHIDDVPSIAQRTGAQVVAIFEVAQWLVSQHDIAEDRTLGMNLGGGVTLPFGHVKMSTAIHSSQLPDGSYGGNPAGFVLTLPAGRIYFACDTALFGEMKMIGDMGLDIAVVPIGDLFTMGPDDALEAVKLLRPRRVLPAHYNTWPPIEQNAENWARRVREETIAEPVILQPGQTLTW